MAVHKPPLRVPCEGSGCSVARWTITRVDDMGLCTMCGELVPTINYRAVQHDRNDVLAMLERGDFG